MCRFHRGWAEDMLPDVVGSLFGKKEEFLRAIALTAVRMNTRNASVFWDSARNVEYVATFLARQQDVEGSRRPELIEWRDRFARDPRQAAYDYWYEIHKGINDALREP
jgi:glyceraldehyde-3-phosphate dehydrogenase (ferredoxin)